MELNIDLECASCGHEIEYEHQTLNGVTLNGVIVITPCHECIGRQVEEYQNIAEELQEKLAKLEIQLNKKKRRKIYIKED